MIVKALQRNAKTHAFDGEMEGGRKKEKPLHYNS